MTRATSIEFVPGRTPVVEADVCRAVFLVGIEGVAHPLSDESCDDTVNGG